MSDEGEVLSRKPPHWLPCPGNPHSKNTAQKYAMQFCMHQSWPVAWWQSPKFSSGQAIYDGQHHEGLTKNIKWQASQAGSFSPQHPLLTLLRALTQVKNGLVHMKKKKKMTISVITNIFETVSSTRMAQARWSQRIGPNSTVFVFFSQFLNITWVSHMHIVCS